MQIILNDDQAQIMRTAAGTVEICVRRRELLGYCSRPPGNADISEAESRLRSDGPWYGNQQVLDRLDSLGTE